MVIFPITLGSSCMQKSGNAFLSRINLPTASPLARHFYK
ncbi:hypothetical protein N7505_007214 [Penicillium chrysogenum]|uniref:Uncharacterized protein n=1 Tax=Penicillium chrysogenum TaxID=5076 RepID=A0ABQ8WCQ6_PENCH|nr:hypothetical protein N7505_007214 [Penicillium chrysogenum]